MWDGNQAKVFAGCGSVKFAGRICEHLKTDLGRSETLTFSDGNTFVRVGETVRAKDVYLVQSIACKPNDEFVELLFWVDAFKRASAKSVTVVMPYFGYAKGDKKDEPRVSIRARVCAEAIEQVGADRVVTMDLHSPQIQGFFKRPVDHLYALPLLCGYIKRNLQLNNLVVVSPDAGFLKQARRFADRLDLPLVIADKVRKGHDERPDILDIIGSVVGRDCLVVDDFSISGGTLIKLAVGLKERGAKTVMACLSHAMLSQLAVERLEHSPIDLLIATDTVDNQAVLASEKVHIVSAAPLFAEAIARIQNGQSLSALF